MHIRSLLLHFRFGPHSIRTSVFVAVAAACALVPARMSRGDKPDIPSAVESHADEAWRTALAIWEAAEPGYQEVKSSQLLAEMLQSAGFKIERGVADIPTAFTATAGAGKPVIGILGEYDALPGLSQEAMPERKPRVPGGYGQGCGHHLLGAAAVTAAIVVAEELKQDHVAGTVRFYGCPAEEGGAGKVFMARAGLFDDCDVVLHWHPSARNAAGDPTCLARLAVKFRFHGTSAHASASPDQGRSALDGVELTCHAAELLREHTPELTRIHHVITAGGGAPNVVPDFAEVFFYVRHPKADVARSVYERLVLCAEGAALATGTKLEVEYLGGTNEVLPNDALSRVTLANLKALNDLNYSPDEQQFAARIASTLPKAVPLDALHEVQDNLGGQNKGSTDVGDVSWLVPTTGFNTVCWVPGTPGHSWQATACGGTSIARKGMLYASKVLASTAYDLFTKPELISEAKAEHARRLGEQQYKSLLEPRQKPPLDYRKAPMPSIAE